MGQKSVSRIIKAFYKGKTAKDRHDRTENYQLFYRDNKIAWIDDNWDLWIDACNWLTPTTRGRLNQLNEVFIIQAQKQWYLKNRDKSIKWDESPIKINKL